MKEFVETYIRPFLQKRIRPIYIQVFGLLWFFLWRGNDALMLMALLTFPVYTHVIDLLFEMDKP